MPVHDWSRAEAWQFHHFHTMWLTHLAEHLNDGGLPPGYEAYAEQRAELYVPDLLALTEADPPPTAGPTDGGVAVAEPRTRRHAQARRMPSFGRALTVRHTSGRRVVAVIELVSPSNKDRPDSVGDFAGKIASMVRGRVHAVVLDILPPGRHDPDGMHPPIWSRLDADTAGDPPLPGESLTFASYRATNPPAADLDYAAVGRPLPVMPLYLDGGAVVDLRLEETYMTGFGRIPPSLRQAVGG